MAVFHVNGPHGEVYEVTAPDNASEADVVAYAQKQHEAQTPAKPQGLMGQVTGFMANLSRGLGVGDEMAAGARTAGNVLTGKVGLGDVAKDYDASMAHQRQLEAGYQQQHPHLAALAQGTGMAATSAIPVGDTANLFAQGSRMANAARGATTAGLTAAAYAAADAGTPGERLRAASSAARNPLVLGLGAAGGSLATPGKPKPTPKIDPNVEMLAREGVTFTPGQMRGGVARAAEDAATSMPFVGEAIQARRTEGVESFNRAVVNRALKPIGETLPDNIPAGSAAVKHAGDVLSKGYEAAIPNRVISTDAQLQNDLRAAIANTGTMTENNKARLASILQDRITSRVPKAGGIDGELYKSIQSGLDYDAARFSRASDPDHHAIGQALIGVQSALENAARRQDPEFAARIDALDRGWAELGRIESAASKSTDLSGVFTPKQYGQAIRAGDSRVRSRGVARGEALSQDIASAGIKVLPSRIGDSGTAGRAAWGMIAAAPGAALGAVTGGGVGALAGIGGTAATLAAASKAYAPEAIAAANRALNDRLPGSARQVALQQLATMAAKDPAVAELRRQVAARLSRVVGVAGGASASPRNVFAQPANP